MHGSSVCTVAALIHARTPVSCTLVKRGRHMESFTVLPGSSSMAWVCVGYVTVDPRIVFYCCRVVLCVECRLKARPQSMSPKPQRRGDAWGPTHSTQHSTAQHSAKTSSTHTNTIASTSTSRTHHVAIEHFFEVLWSGRRDGQSVSQESTDPTAVNAAHTHHRHCGTPSPPRDVLERLTGQPI